MPDSAPRKADSALVIYLHASGAQAASKAWVEAVRELGHPVYSHRPLPGCERTQAAMPALGALCREIGSAMPGRGLLVLRAPLLPDAVVMDELVALLGRAANPTLLTTLSNADPAYNPFADLRDPAGGLDATARAARVRLLAARVLHALDEWPQHLAGLNAPAVELLGASEPQASDVPWAVRQAGGEVCAPEWLYVHDPSAAAANGFRLDPHESPRPAPWGGLARRLQDACAEQDLAPWPDDHPVTLHITHSWGGGVAQWVESFIETAQEETHLQLRAEGPQSGAGAGQRLSLYLGNHLAAPLARWWLQPAITAADDHNPQYAEALNAVCSRYRVDRVLVSSLVGHSLDALRTGRPTIQVLHDQFPAWPLLSVDPGRHAGDLAAAMADPATRSEFPGRPLAAWQALARAYRKAVQTGKVRLVAPSASAAAIRRQLDPDWAGTPIEVIAHGTPRLQGASSIAPRNRSDGRLRLLIPGRMQTVKGAELLRRALPGLRAHAHLTLLGSGKGGEAFFGESGVDVILEYRHSELAHLLTRIGPQAALLLSTVPETFSYTLSEMQEMGIPVIATRLGSLAERVVDGAGGWLVDPTPEALVERVAWLAREPQALAQAREALGGQPHRDLAAMVQDYERLWPAVQHPPPAIPERELGLDAAQVNALDDELRRQRIAARQAGDALAQLREEVAQRTRWAESVKRDLAAEIRRREEWVDRLNAELDARQRHLERTRRELAETQADHERLYQDHQAVLASSSWRLTRPLRVARRMGANFMRSRAWNPLRWPLMLSQLVRNLSTVGVEGTVRRMQATAHTETAPRRVPLVTDDPADTTLPDALPAPDAPRVSIVIPVFNQLHYTAACLRSLVRHGSAAGFEVIVVDDASSDDTEAALSDLPGLVYLRNPENLGFIGSCNRGAEVARGEFVLFLNNDTQVTEDWLDPLVDTFDAHPDAGLVGARLLYPDGTLQECGGLVFSDGSGWNYGRGDDADRPEYQALRETDYCSGAAIILRRTLWTELGGFDAHYAPAYYEDTDLAFKVRERGLKVYVQPASNVVHHEGVTSGTDESSGTKRFQRVNQARFKERWTEALARQPGRIENPDDSRAVRRARDHRLRGRVLVIDAYTPEPDQDSGSVRLTRLMQCLQDLGYGVDFMADNRGYAGRYTRALQRLGVTAWYSPATDPLQAWFNRHGEDWDLVIISRHYVAVNYISLLRKYCPRARFVFDTVDLHYLREQRLAELENSLPLHRVARQTRRSELGVIEAADATLVVSPVEQEVLAEDAPEARVHLLSNIHELSPRVAGFAARKDLFFVGGYQHPPNIDAVTWFVNDIWPQVHAQLPEAEFHIVGSKAPDSVRQLAGDGVVFHGYAESLDPFLDGCRLAVAPLRYGAGVKGKVNHAMAHGQPVVATPMATEGMHAVPGRDILVAETAADFASEVVRVYRDEALWQHISTHGRENVRRHFSMDTAREQLRGLIATLDGDARA